MATIAEMELLRRSMGDLRDTLRYKGQTRREQEERDRRHNLDQELLKLRQDQAATEKSQFERDLDFRKKQGEEERKARAALNAAKASAEWFNTKGVPRSITGSPAEVQKALEEDPPHPDHGVSIKTLIPPEKQWWSVKRIIEGDREGEETVVEGKVTPEQGRRMLSGGRPQESGARPKPKVGDVVDGHRYNGKYPPSDQRAWDKL